VTTNYIYFNNLYEFRGLCLEAFYNYSANFDSSLTIFKEVFSTAIADTLIVERINKIYKTYDYFLNKNISVLNKNIFGVNQMYEYPVFKT
jgi:hypothetical protein